MPPPPIQANPRSRSWRRPPKPETAASLSSLVLAKLGPVIQALPDFTLESTLRRIVERLAAEFFREIVLAGKCLLLVVVVGITAAVTFGLHQVGRRVENVLRRQQRAAVLGSAARSA